MSVSRESRREGCGTNPRELTEKYSRRAVPGQQSRLNVFAEATFLSAHGFGRVCSAWRNKPSVDPMSNLAGKSALVAAGAKNLGV
jgi:hypothetical protein